MDDKKRGESEVKEKIPDLKKIMHPIECTTGSVEDEIIISFYGMEYDYESDSQSIKEYNIAISVDNFVATLQGLVKTGLLYQSKYNKDIGLPIRIKNTYEDGE